MQFLKIFEGLTQLLFEGPGEAWVVLKTSLCLIKSVILFLNIFKTPLLPNSESKGPEILREFFPTPMCHV